MKKYRVPILVVMAGLAAVLPFSGLGSLGIHVVAPSSLCIFITLLFADWSFSTRAVVGFSLVTGMAFARICWDAIILNSGDWSFDGELGLVVMSVVIQLFIAAVTFITTRFVLQGKSNAA